jgi:hypothetical protein
VSLNNRVSIRDAMAARGPIRSLAGTFPSSSGHSKDTADIVLMDLKKSGTALPLGEREVPHPRDSVISEYILDDAITVCSAKTPRDCRYRMIFPRITGFRAIGLFI